MGITLAKFVNTSTDFPCCIKVKVTVKASIGGAAVLVASIPVEFVDTDPYYNCGTYWL